MALESTSFNHLVTDQTLIRVDVLFDRENRSHEIEAIKLLHFESETEKADISDVLLGFSGELMADLERKAEDEMSKLYEFIEDGTYDFEE